jgi:multiple sugar transport system substrate-binding protein
VTVNELDSFAEEVVNTELDKVLDQGKEVQVALADAQKLIERRTKR